MTDLRLDDWITIAVTFIKVVLCVFGGMLLIVLWPRLVQLSGALRRRYMTLSWPDVLSTIADEPSEDQDLPAEELPVATTPQPATTALQSDATYGKGLLDGQARALAIAVKEGRYRETEGIKAIFGVSPSSTNPKYIAARAALKAEIEKLNNPYPQRTQEQENQRRELGLQKR